MKTAPIALSLLVLASVAQAQRVADTRFGAVFPAAVTEAVASPVAMPSARSGRSNGSMVTTGTIFAIAGLFGGAYTGVAIECGNDGRAHCGGGGALLGALAGEVMMLPMGIHHVSNASSYPDKLKLSWAVMLGGMILAPVTAGLSLLAIPPVQLAMIVRAENRARESGTR